LALNSYLYGQPSVQERIAYGAGTDSAKRGSEMKNRLEGLLENIEGIKTEIVQIE
jgi:hypothetical protein